MAERDQRHAAQWWAQFPDASERFDPAYLVDGLSDLLIRRIPAPVATATTAQVTGVRRWAGTSSSPSTASRTHRSSSTCSMRSVTA